jgi:cytochrome P450
LTQGYDTSSTTLCHLLYNLATHPEIQEKVHEDIDKVLGDNKDGPITKEDFFQMSYLDMAVKDTLRMYSPPFVLRELRRDLETG